MVRRTHFTNRVQPHTGYVVSSESRAEQLERRSGARFPLELKLRYRVLTRSGIQQPLRDGKTVNISGHGILFADDKTLTCGTKVEAEVDWPVKLDGKVPLKLIVRGSVVRLEKGRVALAFRDHKFHTRGSSE